MAGAGHPLIGHALPAGSCVADADEHRRMCECFGRRPPADGSVHPVYVFVLTQRGIGMSIEEFLALCGAAAADGPMLGECAIEIFRPLRMGARYEVVGEVTDVRQKQGRALGCFDVITSLITLREDGVDVADCTRAWVLPRGVSGAA